MFNRINYENWHTIVPMIAFALTFAVFTFFSLRAVFLRKHQAERLARLPLEEDSQS